MGQNFLTQPKIAADLVAAGNVTKNDTVLEIGSGKGMLTEKILESGANVVAIEKDSELIKILKEKFEKEIKSGQLTLINEDVRNFKKLEAEKYKIIANIPYYLTGEILRKFLEAKCQPTIMVLMVQKEVAERVVAKDGKESILSISVKMYGTPEMVKRVSAGSFFPKPKVDSAILTIKNISKNNFTKNKIEEKGSPVGLRPRDFFDLLHQGFKSPRKQLRSNLKIAPEKWQKICEKLKISPKARPEDLNLENWLSLMAYPYPHQ